MNQDIFYQWIYKQYSEKIDYFFDRPAKFIFGFIFFLILIILFGLLLEIYLREKKRKKLKEFANIKGFAYNYKPQVNIQQNIAQSLKNFNLFNKGNCSDVRNVLKGYYNGIEWMIFDAYFLVRGGEGSSYTFSTVISIVLNNVYFPKFYIGPKYFFHRIAEMFKHKYINFDNYPLFSKRYALRGENEELIRKLFTHPILKFFEESKNIKKINIEAEGDKFLIYIQNQLLKPKELPKIIDEACKMLRLFTDSTSVLAKST